MEDNYIQRVAAYIRVSSEEQKLHGISLDAQIMKLEEYAQKNNLKIVEWYKDEGVSGRKLIRKRPELQRMLLDAKKGLFERIIFIKLDRFFRSVAEYHECMKMISPVVWTATEEKYDLATASGRAFVNMKLTIAELEADQTGERISIVNDYKIKTGQAITGSMPLGYKIEKIDGAKRVVKDEKTEKVVEKVLELYLIHQSKRMLVELLNHQYGIGISYASFCNLLKNPMYKGEYRGNKKYCPAYLTPEKWDQIQTIAAKNARRNQVRTYIFSGLLICPECGRRLAGCTNVIQKTLLSGSAGKYIYKNYRCTKYRIQNACAYNKAVFEASLEHQLISNMDTFLENYQTRFALQQETKTVPKESVASIRAELDRLNYAWQKNRISMADYDASYEKLMLRMKVATDTGTPLIDLRGTKKALCAGWKGLYETLTEEDKKAFWRSFISEIRLNGKEIAEVDFF